LEPLPWNSTGKFLLPCTFPFAELRADLMRGRSLAANLKVLPIPINLYKPGEVKEAIAELKAHSFECEVLVVDTLFHSSIGAKLTQPEEILPLLEQLKVLMEAVGAKACLLVHHTTKDGEEFFGSVSFLATVEAMIRSEFKDSTTARVSCVRMREDAFFGAFEIKFTKQKVKTKPNKRGVDEFEFLVVGSPAPAEKRPTKQQRNLETMEFVLDFYLNGEATFTDWFEKVHEFTAKKQDGKVVKEGWSETTFRRYLNMLIEQGRVIDTGGAQGDCYSFVETEQAKPGVQPDAPEEGASASQTTASQTTATPLPLQGSGESGGSFGDRQAPPNDRQNENGGGSSESRTERDSSVAMTDLEKEVWENLKGENIKH
jgi:hypothetical protein